MSWYVAIAKNGRTMRAVDELIAIGICLVCPIERYHVRRQGRRYTVEAPLLGRYLLVSADSDDDLSHIANSAEVDHILSSERGPLRVQGRFVDALLEADAGGGYDRTSGKGNEFARGQKVRVIGEGPFADLVGEIALAKGSRRWQIVLDITSIPVNVAEDEMEPIGQGKAA